MRIKRNFIAFFFILSYSLLPAQTLKNAQPDSVVKLNMDSSAAFWSGDSTLLVGAAYGSFADILQVIPGGFFFDRGSVGQPAYGLLFAGAPALLQVNFGGLLLTDPLYGLTDLNWIPVEAIERMELLPPQGRMLNGMNPGSQTLYIEPKDLSGIPVRSSVGYRTGGNDYDDIDTRFGLQLSRRTRLNMGAVLKNYSGTLSVVEKYRSQKVNIAVDRELGRNWQVRYLLLRNRSDLNLPLFQPLPDYPSLNRLHQKEARYDHGLMVEKGQTFSTTLQLIDYHRELYNRGTTLLDQQQDVTQVLWHGLWRGNISLLSFQAGADWRWSRMKSDAWGGHEQAATGGWGQVAMALAPKGRISAGLRLQKWTDAEWTLLPLVKMRYDVTPDWRWMLWGERIVRPAGFAHLYSSGPFALGQATLRNQRSDLLGLGMNRIFSGGHLFLSVSWSSIKDGIWAEIRQDESIPVYRNQPLQQQASLDLAAEWRLSSWFTFNAASKGMLFQKHEPQNWPNVSAQGYVQINHRFFKNDLDARLRIGCAVQGEQEASMPYYSQYSEETMAVGAVLVPYLHAIFIIKDATLFFSMQNPLNQDYYRVYPYPMPRGLFRWGFVWRFFD